jgi:hypothetical protein
MYELSKIELVNLPDLFKPHHLKLNLFAGQDEGDAVAVEQEGGCPFIIGAVVEDKAEDRFSQCRCKLPSML